MKKITGTKEWASHTFNIQNYCENGCKYGYCYANRIRFKQTTTETKCEGKINEKAVNKKWTKKLGRIMFPSTSNIDSGNIKESLIVLTKMLEAGNQVLIVMKPAKDITEKLCDELFHFKDQITFHFTIGSTQDSILKFWEPNAPSFKDRMDSLEFAWKNNFKTSVSIEPILDLTVEKTVEVVYPFVTDTIWLGLMNNAKARLKLNGYDDKDTMACYNGLNWHYTKDRIYRLWLSLKDLPEIRWKDSIKKIVGIEQPQVAGQDI